MSDNNVINIEDKEDITKRTKKNIRQEEIIKLIMRQTNYTEEESKAKLLEWNNNYLNVIKEYINPDFHNKKTKVYKSRNQGIMTEIRGFMDTINKEYYRKKDAAERYKKYLSENHFKAQQQDKTNTKIAVEGGTETDHVNTQSDVSNNITPPEKN